VASFSTTMPRSSRQSPPCASERVNRRTASGAIGDPGLLPTTQATSPAATSGWRISACSCAIR